MKRHLRPIVLRLIVVASVILLLIIFVPRETLRSAWGVLSLLGWRELLVLALVNGVIVFLLPGRWWLLLRAYGFNLSYAAVSAYRLVAYGVSYFTPGPQFGGEPVQVYAVAQADRVPRPIAVATVALDKTLDLAVNFLFLFAGLLYVLFSDVSSIIPERQAVFFAGTLLLIPVSLLIAYLGGRRPMTRIVHWTVSLAPSGAEQKLARRLLELAHASEGHMSAYFRRSPGNFVAVLSVSGLTWLVMIGEFWLLTHFLGLHLTLPQVVALMVAARIALLLPVPGGLGTLIGSQMLMLTAMGMDPAAGLSLGLVVHARDVTLAGLGLLIPAFTNQLRIPSKYTKVSVPSPQAPTECVIENPARAAPSQTAETRDAVHANSLP